LALVPTRRRALAQAAGLALAPAVLTSAGAEAAQTGQAGLPQPLTLKQAAARKGLIYGAAMEPNALDGDPPYAALVAAQCADVTPENVMKWLLLRPTPTTFDFSGADRLVAWAEAHRMKIHGHCLVWHEAIPAWMPKTLTRDAAIHLLQTHITTVVGRYAGRMHSWDVVIEFIERADNRPDGLRRSLWLEAIGPDYMSIALHAANAADPAARLDLEDYGLEYDDIPWMNEKRIATLRLLEKLKAEGAPLHALGIQAQLLGDHPPSFGPVLRQFLRDVAALGLDIYITELDVKDQKTPGDVAAHDRFVADVYCRFLDVVLDEPAVKLVNTWGISDRYSSKSFMAPRADHDVRPLPYDKALMPKPAAQALFDAFAKAPRR
jgi:endo-1,4-beta-xylanase